MPGGFQWVILRLDMITDPEFCADALSYLYLSCLSIHCWHDSSYFRLKVHHLTFGFYLLGL
jgi:hypothetical protein